MAESQPGKVGTFDPEVDLDGFAAGSRDRLMYNENQLVLAKVQQARPETTTARTRTGSDQFIDYAQYINSDGEIAYIDGSFQALDTPGRPTTPVHQIVVGFAQQITTDEIKFWSTSFVDTALLFVQYSFDNVTWFEVGTVTWTQFFDDTIENFPGDAPPTGQYRYTGVIASGNITARYWRIRGDASASFLSESGSNPNKTFVVNSTTNFPNSGSFSAVIGSQSRTMTYTGKTATSFTGVNDPNASNASTTGVSLDGTVNGNLTLTVANAGSFPQSGIVRGSWETFYPNAVPYTATWDISYTAKSGNVLTGVTITPNPDQLNIVIHPTNGTIYYVIRSVVSQSQVNYTALTLFNGLELFNRYAWGSGVTELQVLSSTDPILQHWNSDGTQAVSVSVAGGSYFDMAYDKFDDVYYAIKFSDTILGAATTDPNDDFSTGPGTGFNTFRWSESTTNSYFQRNTTSGTLDIRSSGGSGQLTTNYGVDGDFDTSINLVAMLALSDPGYFSLEAVDYTLNNVHLMSGILAEDSTPISTSATFFAANMTYTDTLGDKATLNNFRVKPEGMDFSFPGGIVDYTFTYVAATGNYSVTVSGISHPPATPGAEYQLDSAGFSISNFTTPADGESFNVIVTVSEDTSVGTAVSGTKLQIERAGTNGYARRDAPSAPGWVATQIGNIPTDRMRIQLFCNPAFQTVDVSADNFVLNPTADLFFDTPVFSVVTLDKDGNLFQVPSVSDVDGFAIKSLDLIQDTTATYNNYLAPRVGIATNGLAFGSGGEIYIKVNGTLYRYLKTTLPLTSPESGSNAATVTVGEIPETGITGFSFNGYSQGGLCYIEYSGALSGTFVRSIDTSTLMAQPEKALLDVTSIDYPFAWNVTDLATLYYVDGNALKLYDLNEAKAAFANVSSNKQVLAAGTQETATVTAQILNVYGEPKSNKTMTFTVSAGDGAISPAIGCSDVNGKDDTTYTVGSAVGVATITVTVSDLNCA